MYGLTGEIHWIQVRKPYSKGTHTRDAVDG